MFEKHLIQKKNRKKKKKKKKDVLCILSEALHWGKHSLTAAEKYRNEVPAEWVKFTEGMKWKNVRVAFFPHSWLLFFLYHYKCFCQDLTIGVVVWL